MAVVEVFMMKKGFLLTAAIHSMKLTFEFIFHAENKMLDYKNIKQELPPHPNVSPPSPYSPGRAPCNVAMRGKQQKDAQW